MFPYKTVIWDWNGTLLDDAWLCLELMNQALARRSMPTITEEEYQRHFTIPVKKYYEALGFDFGKESFELVGTEFIQEYRRLKWDCSLQPGARELIRNLHEAGIKQAVLSAYQHEPLQQIIQHHGLDQYMEHVMGIGDHYGGGKVEQGLELIDRLSGDPGQMVMIGDTDHDQVVAAAMGVDSWLIPAGNMPEEKLRATGARVWGGGVMEILREYFPKLSSV